MHTTADECELPPAPPALERAAAQLHAMCLRLKYLVVGSSAAAHGIFVCHSHLQNMIFSSPGVSLVLQYLVMDRG